jgi:SAM-dependent methyltransferase
MTTKQLENIWFYDELAPTYDAIMDRDDSNSLVRQKVATKFLSAVPRGRILDFGGGTGADLGWLTGHGYQVVFCEPSEGMRDQAIERFKGRPSPFPVQFLAGEATDFTFWHQVPPFLSPVDGVLANFSVFNCIADLGLLFKNLSRVIKPHGSLIALILRPKTIDSVRSFFGLESNTLRVHFLDFEQTVYVHSTQAIQKSSSPYFYFSSRTPITDSVFSLFHLTRR